jgi:hypothetical protein
MTRHQAERAAWMAGVTGLLGAAIGWLFALAAFPHAWLAALTAWLGWPVGCMALLLIHALTSGRWGYAVRPQLVAGMRTLLLLPPAVIPLLTVLRTLLSLGTPGRGGASRQPVLPEPAVLPRTGSRLPDGVARAGRADPTSASPGHPGRKASPLRRSTRPCRSTRCLRPAPTA